MEMPLFVHSFILRVFMKILWIGSFWRGPFSPHLLEIQNHESNERSNDHNKQNEQRWNCNLPFQHVPAVVGSCFCHVFRLIWTCFNQERDRNVKKTTATVAKHNAVQKLHHQQPKQWIQVWEGKCKKPGHCFSMWNGFSWGLHIGTYQHGLLSLGIPPACHPNNSGLLFNLTEKLPWKMRPACQIRFCSRWGLHMAAHKHGKQGRRQPQCHRTLSTKACLAVTSTTILPNISMAASHQKVHGGSTLVLFQMSYARGMRCQSRSFDFRWHKNLGMAERKNCHGKTL